MTEQTTTRGRGRPARGRGTQHIDLTLSLEVLDFLAKEKERDQHFSKSAYVDRAVKEQIKRDGFFKSPENSSQNP